MRLFLINPTKGGSKNEKKDCRGELSGSINNKKITSKIEFSSGKCKRNIPVKPSGNLEFLNLEKIYESLREDLIVEELGSKQYRISYGKQNGWSRSYIFDIDKKSKTIFPEIP